jgi:hypothetical protein
MVGVSKLCGTWEYHRFSDIETADNQGSTEVHEDGEQIETEFLEHDEYIYIHVKIQDTANTPF